MRVVINACMAGAKHSLLISASCARACSVPECQARAQRTERIELLLDSVALLDDVGKLLLRVVEGVLPAGVQALLVAVVGVGIQYCIALRASSAGNSVS